MLRASRRSGRRSRAGGALCPRAGSMSGGGEEGGGGVDRGGGGGVRDGESRGQGHGCAEPEPCEPTGEGRGYFAVGKSWRSWARATLAVSLKTISPAAARTRRREMVGG